MLRAEALDASYGEIPVLRGVSIEAAAGEAVAVIGPNGAGKTTLLRAIVGMLRPRKGRVLFDGRRLDGLRAFQVSRLGIAYVPAEKELFPGMSVSENLELGAYRDAGATPERLRRVFGLFPRLQERSRQLAGTLSGGEQQMLAIGRALMGEPKALLLDEPSTGLAPLVVAELYRQLTKLKAAGLTLVITEQQVPLVLSLTDRAYVLEEGTVRMSGRSAELLGDAAVKRAYLGVG